MIAGKCMEDLLIERFWIAFKIKWKIDLMKIFIMHDEAKFSVM